MFSQWKLALAGIAATALAIWYKVTLHNAKQEGRREANAEIAELQLNETLKTQRINDEIETRNKIDINSNRPNFFGRMRRQQNKKSSPS